MNTEQLKKFVAENDFGYAETTGVFCAVCDNEARESVQGIIDKCNSPEDVTGERLSDLLSHHPEFNSEIQNGCTIYSCDEYDGANLVNTHFIAYYE